jgi:hypothetical protein
VEAALLHAEGQTDKTKLIGDPWDYKNEPNNILCSLEAVTVSNIRELRVWQLTAHRISTDWELGGGGGGGVFQYLISA